MEKEKKERIVWIDLAKAFAILGVLVDHAYDAALYQDWIWRRLTYYSVSLFMILLGVTSWFSYEKYAGKVADKLKKDCLRIVRPYLVAAFFYFVVRYGTFDLINYLNGIVHFNICAPYYFVLLYLQTILIVPLLYAFLNAMRGRRFGLVFEALGFVAVLVVAGLTTRYTNILSVYGGGGKLFGGTYLCLVYLGMWFAMHYRRLSAGKAWIYRVLLPFGVVGTVLWWKLISAYGNAIDKALPLGASVNPPGISYCVYALLVAGCFFLLDASVRNEKLRLALSKLSLLGRHTLYIYLWHKLILDYWLPTCFGNTILMDHIWPKRIVYYGCLILLPVCIEYVAGMIGKAIGKAYGEVGKKRDE